MKPSSLSRRRFLGSSAALAAVGLLFSRRGQGQDRLGAIPGKELLVRSADPLNAEPALAALVAAHQTPLKHFYIRSHGPVPKVAAEGYRLQIEGLVGKPARVSLTELKDRFAAKQVDATLTCAGNRRQELSAIKPVGGVQWDAGAIGHARWNGPSLAEVLRSCELKEGAKHVWFEGLDSIPEKDGSAAPFGGSIPLDKALAGDLPTLLAHTMNGEPLTEHHGAPLRTLVPGYIGARSVKWLGKIVVSDRPSPNHYLAEAYKLVQTDSKEELAEAPPLYAFGVNAAICLPAAGTRLKAGSSKIAGYALPSGENGCKIAKVELSTDGGANWTSAKLDGEPAPAAWALWSAEVDLPAGKHQLVARATDSAGHTMPEQGRWNLKGYMQNGWHRVAVEAA